MCYDEVKIHFCTSCHKGRYFCFQNKSCLTLKLDLGCRLILSCYDAISAQVGVHCYFQECETSRHFPWNQELSLDLGKEYLPISGKRSSIWKLLMCPF